MALLYLRLSIEAAITCKVSRPREVTIDVAFLAFLESDDRRLCSYVKACFVRMSALSN